MAALFSLQGERLEGRRSVGRLRTANEGPGKFLAHYVRHTAVRAYAGRYASPVGGGKQPNTSYQQIAA